MMNLRALLFRWGPPVLWMAAIFFASATPSYDLPHFGSLDYIAKKTGHVLAYALLCLLFRRALGPRRARDGVAWLLAVGYALLDEFHQSLVPGRHPSLVDAFGFDGGGAALALLGMLLWNQIRGSFRQRRQTGS